MVFLPFFIFALQQAAFEVQTPFLQQTPLQAQAAALQQATVALPVLVDVVT